MSNPSALLANNAKNINTKSLVEATLSNTSVDLQTSKCNVTVYRLYTQVIEQLSQRDRTAGGRYSFGQKWKMELGDNILPTL